MGSPLLANGSVPPFYVSGSRPLATTVERGRRSQLDLRLRYLGAALRRLAVVFALAGCGAGSTGNGFSTTPGSSVLPAGVDLVTFTSLGGGLHPSPPSGAACDPYKWTYAVSFTDQTLSSMTCNQTGDFTDPTTYVPNDELLSLDGPEWTSVESAMAAVRVSDKTTCGADAEQRELTVKTAKDSLTYGDDFFACDTSYTYFVTSDSLANLQMVLSAIP